MGMSVIRFFCTYRAAMAAAFLIVVAMASRLWSEHALSQPVGGRSKLTIDDLGVETVDSPKGRMITEEGMRELARRSEAERNKPFSVPQEQLIRDSWIDGIFAASILLVAVLIYFLVHRTTEARATLAAALGMSLLAFLVGLGPMSAFLIIASALFAFIFRK
jgi:hypothetical protein